MTALTQITGGNMSAWLTLQCGIRDGMTHGTVTGKPPMEMVRRRTRIAGGIRIERGVIERDHQGHGPRAGYPLRADHQLHGVRPGFIRHEGGFGRRGTRQYCVTPARFRNKRPRVAGGLTVGRGRFAPIQIRGIRIGALMARQGRGSFCVGFARQQRLTHGSRIRLENQGAGRWRRAGARAAHGCRGRGATTATGSNHGDRQQ